MSLRYLSASNLRRALPMKAAIATLEAAMRDAALGVAKAPPRMIETLERGERKEPCVFLVMPAVWRQAAAAKIISYVPDNPAEGRETIQGTAVLLDATTGSPRLVVDASTLTTIRTGAMVGLATRFLARRDAKVVGVVGTGAIAADLVAGVAAVRAVRRVLACNRTRDRADRFAAAVPWATEVDEDANAVAARSDVLVTATTSTKPVVSAEAIRPGTHINAVGNFSPRGRELDGDTVAACARYVDDMEAALGEAGELILAARDGLIPAGSEGVTGDLQGLACGAVAGRADDRQLTLFKSVGTAIADVAALVAAAERAEAEGLGLSLE